MVRIFTWSGLTPGDLVNLDLFYESDKFKDDIYTLVSSSNIPTTELKYERSDLPSTDFANLFLKSSEMDISNYCHSVINGFSVNMFKRSIALMGVVCKNIGCNGYLISNPFSFEIENPKRYKPGDISQILLSRGIPAWVSSSRDKRKVVIIITGATDRMLQADSLEGAIIEQ